MVYLPIDPTVSVPTIERTPARPEPIQSPAPVDSFNYHLERAQTKDTAQSATTTDRPTDVEENEPTDTEEEQVHTDLTDSQTQADSTEGAETEEAGEARPGESESEQGEQTESTDTQDVVEIATEVVVIDETLGIPKPEDAKQSSENASTETEATETESTEQAKSNQASASNSELPDGLENSTGQQQSPDQHSGSEETSVTESIPAAEPSESEGELQQVVSVKDDSQDDIQTTTDDSRDETQTTDESSGLVSASKEQERDGETLARHSKAVESVTEQSEARNTNSTNSEQQQQPQQQQQSSTSTKSKPATETKNVRSSDDSTEEASTAVHAQSSKPQAVTEASTERDLGSSTQSKPQAVEKIEGGGNLAAQSSGTEPHGEEGATMTRSAISRTAASSSADATKTEPTPDVSRVRFVQRVARAFQSLEREGGEVRLRLSPPELGALRLEVTVQRGVLSARLETETPAARALLLDNLPALRERLEQQDIKIANFDVDLMKQPPDGMRDNLSDDAQWQREYRERGSREVDSVHEPAASNSTDPFQSGDDGTLNVVV